MSATFLFRYNGGKTGLFSCLNKSGNINTLDISKATRLGVFKFGASKLLGIVLYAMKRAIIPRYSYIYFIAYLKCHI